MAMSNSPRRSFGICCSSPIKTQTAIADNGPGFPEEKLQVLNQKVTEFQYNSTQVGVDNIKYRMYLIYGGEAQLYFYNKPLGGAVTEMLLPERKYEFTDC